MWHGKSGSPCQHGSFPKWWNWLVYNEIPVSITHLTADMNINDHLNLKLQAVHSPLSIVHFIYIHTSKSIRVSLKSRKCLRKGQILDWMKEWRKSWSWMDLQVEQLLIKKPWSLQGEKEKEKEIKVGTFGIYKKPKFRVFLFQDFIWYLSSLSLVLCMVAKKWWKIRKSFPPFNKAWQTILKSKILHIYSLSGIWSTCDWLAFESKRISLQSYFLQNISKAPFTNTGKNQEWYKHNDHDVAWQKFAKKPKKLWKF